MSAQTPPSHPCAHSKGTARSLSCFSTHMMAYGIYLHGVGGGGIFATQSPLPDMMFVCSIFRGEIMTRYRMLTQFEFECTRYKFPSYARPMMSFVGIHFCSISYYSYLIMNARQNKHVRPHPHASTAKIHVLHGASLALCSVKMMACINVTRC